MAMTVERLADTFVARVGGVDLAKLDDAAWAEVHRAYLDHKVLLFRGQRFTPQELIAFSERFGPVEPHTVRMYRHAEAPGITILSNRVEMGRPKGIRDAGSHWHSDYSYRAIPANVTILYALEVPEEGGDTIVCDLQAAWESLPEDVKRRVDGRMQRIEYRWTRDREHPESRWKLLSEDERRETPEVVHPVVRTHPETGRKALFVFSGLTSGVKGIVDTDEAESDELLGLLFAHAEQDRFQYRVKWTAPGDVLLWDNRCTMHRATTDVLPPDKPRTLWRVNTLGDRPA